MGTATATRADVSRLFGRAAFGATEADLDAWTGKPYAAAVESLLSIPATRAPAPDDAARITLEQTGTGGGLGAFYLVPAQSWWLERMRTTQYPLEERMTWFWHGHFATGPREGFPDTQMLMAQNQTLRTHAIGNFREMAAAITLDPAMLWWLDGTQSAPPQPNENYAREFFELFSLGKHPQVYAERDVREAARAFTGWVDDGYTRMPRFDAGRHDHGRKRILGKTIGDLADREYLAVIDIALAQPVAPRFIAARLVNNFGYPVTTPDVLTDADPLVRKVASGLRAGDWDVGRAVRTMLLAPEFRYAPGQHARQLLRSPVEVVVHACKALDVRADDQSLLDPLQRMGQVPFAPPNVGGWAGGKSWLSPATMLGRYEAGLRVYSTWAASVSQLRTPLPPSNDLAAWTKRLGLAGLSPATSTALRRYLAARKGASEQDRQTSILTLLLASPEWTVM
ncbi:MAG: DUF1800 family protein [Mycobacteriales bacterium]|nr:DUF1800 domain-containing protein [Frankia sp.]